MNNYILLINDARRMNKVTRNYVSPDTKYILILSKTWIIVKNIRNSFLSSNDIEFLKNSDKKN